nr:ORF117 [Acipenserid herpesvirus 1]
MTLFHAKRLTHTDLPNIQAKIIGQPTVRVYYLKGTTDKSSLYLLCHRVIYDVYLAKHGNLQHVHNISFCYFHTYRDQAEMVLICLYLKHLNMIDSTGRLNAQYTIDLPGIYNNYLIRDLARYHDLEWLCRLYIRAKESHDLYQGVLLKRGDQIVCVGSDQLVSVGLPQHNKVFTTSEDGRTWYVLCAPNSTLIEIWMKLYEHNTWTKLTAVKSRLHADTYEMVLADKVCLYVLKDGYRLECYNLSTQQWHQIQHSELQADRLTFKLVKTGDGSQPLTLVANSQARQVLTCCYNQYQWSWEPSAMVNPYNLTHQINPILWTNPDNTAPGYYRSLVEQRPQPGLVVELIDQICREEGFGFFPPTDVTQKEVFNPMDESQALAAIAHSGHNFIQNVQDQPTFFQYHTLLEKSDQWVEITAFKKALWGHTVRGEWFLYQHNKWTQILCPFGGGILCFNPEINRLCRVVCDNIGFDQAVLTLDEEQLELDLFNPNYVDGSFIYTPDVARKYHPTPHLSGLKCLEYAQVSKNSQNKLMFDLQKGIVAPPALQLFLDTLNSEMSEMLFNKNQDLVYLGGGVKHLNNTQIEMYITGHPKANHVVLKDSLKQFFARYVNPQSVQIVGMGSTLIDKSSRHTLFHLRERALTCFEYE